VTILGIDYDTAFFLAFALGVAVLFLFSLEKFDKPYPGNNHLSELLPSNLSQNSAYAKAFLIYFALLVVFFGILCFVSSTATGILDVVFGPGSEKAFLLKSKAAPADAIGPTVALPAEPKARPKGPAEIPLVIALLMVGLFPKYKKFGEIEAPIRRFSHRLIGIPDGLDKLADEIAVTPLRSSTEQNNADESSRLRIVKTFLGFLLSEMPEWARARLAERVSLPDLAPDGIPPAHELSDAEQDEWTVIFDDAKPRIRVADKWLRATTLFHKVYSEPSRERKATDTAARRKYEKLLNELKLRFEEVSRQIEEVENANRTLFDLIEALAHVRSPKRADASDADRSSPEKMRASLRILMRKGLDELEALEPKIENILSKEHVYIAAATILRKSSVNQAVYLSEAYDLETQVPPPPVSVDDVLLAVIFTIVPLFVLNYALYWTAPPPPPGEDNAALTALRLVISALLMHGSAALIAFWWQGRLRKQTTRPTPVKSRPVRRYLGLSLLAYVPVFFGLILWAMVAKALSEKVDYDASQLLTLLPVRNVMIAFAVLAAATVVTAIFTALNIDYAATRRFGYGAIALRALCQGILTAAIVFVSTQVQVPGDVFFAVSSTLNGFVVGLVLGFSVLRLSSQAGISTAPAVGSAAAPDNGASAARATRNNALLHWTEDSRQA
jgi:hypothetical protein